jgi:hypothetical protein
MTVDMPSVAPRSDQAAGPGLLRPAARWAPYQSRRELGDKLRPKERAYIDKVIAATANRHYVDSPFSITADGSTPPNGLNSQNALVTDASMTAINLMGGISQGAGITQRNGCIINLDCWEFRYRVLSNAALSAGDMDMVRVIAFQWKSLDIPTSAFILKTVAWDSSYNHDKQGLYRVVYDKTHTLVKGAPSQHQVAYVENDRWVEDGIVRYLSSDSPGQNRLWLIFVGTRSSNQPTIDYYSRVEFTD